MSKQTHFTRLRRLRNQAHNHSLYEWFGVRTFSQDFEILEQIAEEIAKELQNNYLSPYKEQGRNKTDKEKKEASLILNITFRYMRIVRDSNLKAEYDYELEKEIRKQQYQKRIDELERESFSRATNPNRWAPEKEESLVPSSCSDSEIIEAEDFSDESIDAPPIIVFDSSSNPEVSADTPMINIKMKSSSEKRKPSASLTRSPSSRAKYRQKKRKQQRQLSLVTLGALAGILIGYLLLKVLNLQ